ncbi:hypothetical protein [Spirosoma radiotolerans]|uniref:hypothetical protein n=1 Tax=Spirosoma radiotolerans TaxID=1379870 RepID=UPI00130E2D34|nr:hypothetical protein [Spirosoma radiotolerans]
MDLFVECPDDKDYYVLNPDASRKYFTNQKIATRGNVEPFKKKKDKNTMRIFVLGESTTIGYPYFHNGSFHRWLQYRLTHTFPDRNFDVINLSLTAVNSYTTYGFARELIDYEPDAVLIYTGHNEYYGALGVGSTEQISGIPQLVDLILYLRQFRLVQLLTNGYETIRRSIGGEEPSAGGTRMKLMVADQQIPYQSMLYKQGVEQFRRNMDRTLQLLAKRAIPVFVSNLVSNEKDLKPFVSFPAETGNLLPFNKTYNLGLTALTRGNLPLAYSYFNAANRLDSSHALCTYYLGRTAYLQGNLGQAKRYFSRAKDLDGLRFRAPDVLNTIIRQLCQQYKNTHFVDTKALFESHSVNSIIGDELILEHVHPDLKGYALLSDAFYNALKQAKLITLQDGQEMSLAQLLRDMPITKVDSLAGLYKVANLKRNWPFNEAMSAQSFAVESVEEKLAYSLVKQQLSWSDALSDLYDFYMRSRALSKARQVVETLVLEYSTDVRYYEKAAMLSGELNDRETAIFYFKKAFALAPTFDKARHLFVLYLQLDRPSEALPYLNYASQNNQSQFDLGSVKATTEQIISLKQRYLIDSTNVSLLNQIANAYYRMDNAKGASKYIQKVLRIDAANKEALSMVAYLNSNRWEGRTR